ncbi:MAG TPA: transglutaminase domain-containing protein [Ruminococcus sp.]|nr:transglutaminase domain-containing protein [Ruminococcus sp.]
MKKWFRSGFSLLTSLAMVTGTTTFTAFADSITTTSGVIDMSEEEINFAEFEEMGLTIQDIPAIKGNYNDGAYNYGYSLDENNAEVYMAFMKLINPSTDEVTVTLPNPVKFSSSTRNFGTTEGSAFYEAVFTNCKPGMDCASFDLPELFWLDEVMTNVRATQMPYTYNWLTREYTFTIETLTFSPAIKSGYGDLETVIEAKSQLDDKVNEIAEIVTKDADTRYDIIKNIHDYICLNTYYTTECIDYSSAYGALVDGNAVCEGYSKAFKIVCDALDIPCVDVFGNWDKEDSTAHMWNYVQMEDGIWYAIDVTWDDNDGKDGREIVYRYFLDGSLHFLTAHDPSEDFDITYFTYPEISKTAYDPNKAVPGTTTPIVTTTTSTSTVTTTTTDKPTTTTTKPTTTTTKPTTTKPTTTTTKPTTTKKVTQTTLTTTKKSGRKTTTTTVPPVTTAPATTAAVPVTTVPVQPLKGDVNRDGVVNMADLVYCAEAVNCMIIPEYSCDVNEDGRMNVFDVVVMRQLIPTYSVAPAEKPVITV